jgi:hypothetical protein
MLASDRAVQQKLSFERGIFEDLTVAKLVDSQIAGGPDNSPRLPGGCPVKPGIRRSHSGM